jgi:hypothetical protein
MEKLMIALAALRRWALQLGPLVAIEIVLPGGTLIVALLLLYRRWRAECRLIGGCDFATLGPAPMRASAQDVHNAPFAECRWLRGRRAT